MFTEINNMFTEIINSQKESLELIASIRQDIEKLIKLNEEYERQSQNR